MGQELALVARPETVQQSANLLAVVHFLDSMSIRDALGLILERHCQTMGAPEARDGMLLCGVGTAYIRPRGVKI
jgi:hypothetical protein